MNKLQKIIIKKMANGYTQPEVAQYLKRRKITPGSLSSVEKELQKLRKDFKAQSTVHLFVLLIRQGYLKL